MADQDKDPTPAAAGGGKRELFTIEELAAKHATPSWVFAGVKVAQGWGAGKRVSEAEYKRAVDQFKRGPMCRGRADG
mgnify:FL=1